MNDVAKNPIPMWFWAIGLIALLWNLMGLMAFAAQMMMSPEALAALPAEQRRIYETTPTWVNIAFALAVVTGTLGCVGLLRRQNWAFPMFVVSLLAVLAQMAFVFLMSDSVAVMGMAHMVLPILVAVIALGLVWYSRLVVKRGWITR